MSKVLRVQGSDYKVVVGSTTTPGNILLDTNPSGLVGAQGEVRITGDLYVAGNTTTIRSETLEIDDNIIYLNRGEPGPGVTPWNGQATSGFQISRGSAPDGDVSLLFYEDWAIDPAQPSVTESTWVFRNADEDLLSIATNKITTKGENLTLIGGGNGIITVEGTIDYEQGIIDYSLIGITYTISQIERSSGIVTITTVENIVPDIDPLVPGKNRVDVACTSTPSINGTYISVLSTPTANSFTYANAGPDIIIGFPGSATGTVRPNPVINDDYIPNIKAVADYFGNALSSVIINKIQENDTKVQTYDLDTSGVSKITFDIDGTQRAILNNNGLTVDNVRIKNNSISNISNDDLLVDSILSLANRVSVPSTPTGYVKVYSSNVPGTGGTGLYFVNTLGTNDELISKTKALLYSLIL